MSTIIILPLLLLSFTGSFSWACNPLDRAALLSFKSSFPSDAFPDWSNNSSSDCCYWTGVRCKRTGRIRHLVITNNPNVTGPIPPSIGDLTELEMLSFLTVPNLVGSLPPQLAKLTKLRAFYAYATGLSGPIPSFLSRLTNLIELDLSSSNFEGPIPPSLDDLTKLTFLTLSSNKLSGTIPPLFSKYQHTNVGYLGPVLDLSNNKLTGSIPPSFGAVPFQTVELTNNELTGDASFLFGSSKQALEIQLGHNKLSFDLTPVEYPENLSTLDLSHNHIYGNISPQIINSTVSFVDFSYNELCGKLPQFNAFITAHTDASKFEHNKCLCGTPLPPCK